MRKIRDLAPWSVGLLALASCATMGTNEETAQRSPVWIQSDEPNTVPAGTEIAIRVNDEINTEQPIEGRTFSGALAQDIRAHGGEIMVPQGSPVELAVVKKSTGGGAFETPEITLAVQSITVNGRRYLISTEAAAQRGDEGVGVNERTGIYTGGGAAVGTVLGAVIGGTEGAVIGGVLGGAAGAAAQVLTQGKQVKVPAGTVITFRLDETWRLREVQPRKDPEPQPVS